MAEGNAYWRGTFEHAAFQDTLLAIGDPLAYSSPFWKNSPYFACTTCSRIHTHIGDTPTRVISIWNSRRGYMEHVVVSNKRPFPRLR